MIIVCSECSTRFNINSERIPDGGGKVRCARCKYVFFAEKPISTVATETVPEFPEAAEEETDFCYDKFQELDSGTTKEETFTFGDETESESADSFSDAQQTSATASDPDDEGFTFSESNEETVSTIEKIFTGVDEPKEPVNEEATAEEVTKAFTTAEETEKLIPPAPTAVKRKSSSVTTIIRVLLLLILGLLITGGVFVFMNGTDQLNQTIQQIFGQQTNQAEQTGQITIGDLEGRFIQNDQEGELFLIRGKAINNFKEARTAIKVRGVVFDQNGKPLMQKTVFCGNPIDDKKIMTLPFPELEKIMGNQFGNELSNLRIDSQQSIPFDIVFKNLPRNLSEFSVKVTFSKPATQ